MEENLLIIFGILLGISFIGIILSAINIITSTIKIKNLKNRMKNLHQDKIWSWFIEDVSKFVYKGWCEYVDGMLVHEWSYGHYTIMVWLPIDGKGDATSSIHSCGYRFVEEKNVLVESGDCVISGFNENRSKQLASILLRGLWEKKLYVYGNR